MNRYIETVSFEQNMPVACGACKVSYYHLHCHEDAIEVLMVLSGNATVKVSFEQFDMNEGDYIVINYGDSHSIYAADSKCQIVSLYFKLDYFKEHIPFLDYALFACESFDLVKYKNETKTLRRMIANIILGLTPRDQLPLSEISLENLIKAAEELLWIFVNDYDMRNYYNRNWNAGYHKTEKYYSIMKYIFENYSQNNLIDYISKNEFYSKSYITHFFKEIGASSFQDVLTYIRLYKSEKLLLNSKMTIVEISDYCGFSDIKYYTSNFKKWFLHTPSEYRKHYQPEITKNSLFQKLRSEDLIKIMEEIVKSDTDNTQYKTAINPLSIKTKDTWINPFDSNAAENLMMSLSEKSKPDSCKEGADAHQICISISDKTDLSELASRVPSFHSQGFIPVLLINYKELSQNQCKDLVLQCSAVFSETGQLKEDIEIIIAYSNLGDKTNISKLVRSCTSLKKITLKPMMMAL